MKQRIHQDKAETPLLTRFCHLFNSRHPREQQSGFRFDSKVFDTERFIQNEKEPECYENHARGT